MVAARDSSHCLDAEEEVVEMGTAFEGEVWRTAVRCIVAEGRSVD